MNDREVIERLFERWERERQEWESQRLRYAARSVPPERVSAPNPTQREWVVVGWRIELPRPLPRWTREEAERMLVGRVGRLGEP